MPRVQMSDGQRFALAASFVAVAVAAIACGSRGPLNSEDGLVDASPADAGFEAAPTADDAAAADAFVVDAGREAGVVECGSCVFQTCGSFLIACGQSASCRTAFECVLRDCVADGIDTACVAKCALEDPAGAFEVFKVFECVTNQCGSDCGPVLGDLLGGGGRRDQ